MENFSLIKVYFEESKRQAILYPNLLDDQAGLLLFESSFYIHFGLAFDGLFERLDELIPVN